MRASVMKMLCISVFVQPLLLHDHSQRFGILAATRNRLTATCF